MATPPLYPSPWIIRRARPLGGRGPRPRPTASLIVRAEEEPLLPRRLELELAQEHRHPLGEAGGGALLLADGEAGAWAVLLRCPPAVATEILPFLEPRARQAVLAELAVARRHRWARRAGQARQQQQPER